MFGHSRKGAAMTRTRRVGIAIGLKAGAVLAAGAGALVMAAAAGAEPPPNCTAADIAGVAGSVTITTSGYLFTHPDVNAFFSGLEGLPEDQVREQARSYLEANPQVAAELRGIRQPLNDVRARCNVTLPIQQDALG